MATNVQLPPATRTWQEERTASGDCLVEQVQKLGKEGNVRRIIVNHDGDVILELPLTLGVAAALLQPQLAGLAAVAALVTSCTIAVEREEPQAGGPSGPPLLDAD